MKTVIVYENSNISFEGDNALKAQAALHDAESLGAKGCSIVASPSENSFIGEKVYWINTDNYLYWYTEAE